MNAYFKLTWMQLKLFGREPVALFFTLVFPLMVLLLFGMIFGNAADPQYGPQYGGGYGYIDALVPGLAAIIIGTVALMSIPVATATGWLFSLLRRCWCLICALAGIGFTCSGAFCSVHSLLRR
jgi:ABC-2 type transport system permease protein